MKKSLLTSISLASLGLILSGCSGMGGKPTASHPIMDVETHHVDGTLHDIEVRESNVPFVQNGVTTYKILIPADSTLAIEAAAKISSHVKAATGTSIPVEKVTDVASVSYDSNSTYIVMGLDALAARAGVTKASADKLQVGGYQIVTKGKSAFLLVNHSSGYQQVAICFLKHVVGFERVAQDQVYYGKSGETLPSMNIVERPDFQARTQSNKINSTNSYEMGFKNSNEVFYCKNGIKTFHNSFDWVKPAECKASHPKWYSDKGNQICPTAHGDATERAALIDHIFSGIKQGLTDDPNAVTFTFTMEDNLDWCNCSACFQAKQRYGADSATTVMLMNDLDDKVQAYLQQEADRNHTDKREVDLLFFAYLALESSPTTIDSNGNFAPVDENVICNDHVCPYIAIINADYQHSLYSDSNLEEQETLQGWHVLAKKVYMWLYETNFHNYLYPMNTFSTMIESYRYCADIGAFYMYNEGQHEQGAATAFGRFKEYFNMVSEIDVNTDYNSIVDSFFSKYFGPAKEPMLKFFYEIQDHMYNMTNRYSNVFTGSIYDDIESNRYWPRKLLDRWMGYIDEAYKAIAPVESTDIELYTILRNHVKLESIFPRFATLRLYESQFTESELSVLHSDFISDCESLGVSHIRESNTATIASLKDSVSWSV